jgi:hypothetical protein
MAETRKLMGIGLIFGVLRFWGKIQRRGGRVNTLKIGSRGGVLGFGGIWEFYAVLRRDLIWGLRFTLFLGVVGGVPRERIEEGTTVCSPGCV